MLKVDTIKDIRIAHFVEGKGIREISNSFPVTPSELFSVAAWLTRATAGLTLPVVGQNSMPIDKLHKSRLDGLAETLLNE